MKSGALELLNVLNELCGLHIQLKPGDMGTESLMFAEALRARYLGPDAAGAAKSGHATAQSERARILALLQDLKPRVHSRTHGDWARGWREAGELAMWERMVKAIGGE